MVEQQPLLPALRALLALLDLQVLLAPLAFLACLECLAMMVQMAPLAPLALLAPLVQMAQTALGGLPALLALLLQRLLLRQHLSRKFHRYHRMTVCAVAVFNGRSVHGEVVFEKVAAGIRLKASFTKLPAGDHGFHIHKAGDLRGEGCKLACDHFHIGPAQTHGGAPGSKGDRHTGDLGNISLEGDSATFSYTLKGLGPEDLWGRSMIVHADPDDLGLGEEEDSKTTGHSGKRIACAVIGRAGPC